MPLPVGMDPGRDFDEIVGFSSRLRLLAQLQAAYLDILREQGFDEEQAFLLMRDWSNRAFDWTLRPPLPVGAPFPPAMPEQADPSVAAPGESYLIAVDDEFEYELRELDDAAPGHGAGGGCGDDIDLDQAA